MLKKKDIVTLSDDKEYVVIATALYKDETYLFLVGIDDNTKFYFGKEKMAMDKIKIQLIKDENLIKEVLPYLYKNVEKEFKKIIKAIKE